MHQGALHLARQARPDILLLDFALSRGFDSKLLMHCQSLIPCTGRRDSSGNRESTPGRGVQAWSAWCGVERIIRKVWLKSIHSVMAGRYWLETGSLGVLVEALRESLARP